MADVDAPVKLDQRTVLGKGLNRLRSDGVIPAVIHNHGQESIHVMAPEMELTRIYQAAGKHHPLNLEVGDDKYLALIKDAHFDPVKRRLQHVVFQAIRQDEKVEAEVPIRLEGDIPAEKVGLMVLHQLDAVEIEALPRNLPDELVVSAEKLARAQVAEEAEAEELEGVLGEEGEGQAEEGAETEAAGQQSPDKE
jgi:ribosomal protein bL25 (Ctc-form)